MFEKNYNKVILLKKEDSYGNLSDLGQASLIPRTACDVDYSKEITLGNALRNSQQDEIIYTGSSNLALSIQAELKSIAFSALFRAALGTDYDAYVGISVQCSLTQDGDNYRLTRSTGSFIGSGITKHSCIYLYGGTLPTVSDLTVLIVLEVQSAYLVLQSLNKLDLELFTDKVTNIALAGSVISIPESNQQQESFRVEIKQSDASANQVLTGLVVSSVNFNSTNGFPEVSFTLQGKDLLQSPAYPYFTSEQQYPSEEVLGCYGAALIDSRREAISSCSIQVQRELSKVQYLSSDSIDGLRQGFYNVTASITAYCTDDYLYNKYLNKELLTFSYISANSSKDNAGFVRITLPRCRITQYKKDDSSSLLQQIQLVSLCDTENNVSSLYIQENIEHFFLWDDSFIWDDTEFWLD